MNVLAVETAADIGSVAVWTAEGAHAVALEERRRHGTSVGPASEEALGACGIKARDLTAIGVGLGPGSYTGARIAVTFAKTMAYTLDIPLVGLSGFMAVAADADVPAGSEVVVIAPGHKTRVYAAVYRTVAAGGVPVEVRPPALCVEEDLRAEFGDATILGTAAEGPVVRAESLARLAARWLEEGRAPSDVLTIEPLYLQPSAPERKAAGRD